MNAAAFGSRAVQSIPHAIQLVGRAVLSRWLLVMLATSVGSANPIAGEAVAHALVRARFCELLSLRTGSGDPSARFLVGLLSRLDVLLGEPIAKVLDRMPVTNEVRDALLLNKGPHAPVFLLAIAYESGDWETVDAFLGQSESGFRELAEIYSQATAWAGAQLNSAKS